METHSSIPAWEIPWTEDPGSYSPWGHKESDTTEYTTPLLSHHLHDVNGRSGQREKPGPEIQFSH